MNKGSKYDILKWVRRGADITVKTLDDLYAIKTYRRKWGMVVAVYDNEGEDIDVDADIESDNGLYQLVHSYLSEVISDNANWVRIDNIIDVYVRNHGVYAAYEYLMKERIFGDERVTLLKKPSGVLSGGLVSYEGTGLNFLVSDVEFLLWAKFYEASLDGVYPYVTLAAADPTYSRIDVIAVKSKGIEEDSDVLQGEIVVITGEAGMYPPKPSIGDDHLELTHILLPAGAMTFDLYVTEEIIYDENIEWINDTLRSGATTFNPDSVAESYRGTKSFEVSGLTGNTVTISFQQDAAATPFDMTGYGAIPFFLKLKAATTGRVYVSAQWMIYGAEPISSAVHVEAANGTTDWQALQIPVRELALYGTGNPSAAWLYFRITIEGGTGHPGFYLDYIKWAGGIAQPVINDEIRLIGDVIGEGRVGEEIETELAVITDGGTKGGANTNLQITYDEKGRIIAVEEFEVEGGWIEFRVYEGWLEWRYVPDADADDADGEYGWTQLFEIPENGLTPEFRYYDGWLQWKYTTEDDLAWRDLTQIWDGDGDVSFGGDCRLQVGEVTLSAAGWSGAAGAYSYIYEDDRIHTTSAVCFIPTNGSVQAVIDANVLPMVDVEQGKATIHAENFPADIGVYVEIYCVDEGEPPIPSGFARVMDSGGNRVVDFEGNRIIARI